MSSILFILIVAGGDIWPEIRGPQTNGHSDCERVPLVWSEEENVAWKTKVHGRGWSTPVLHGGTAWFTTATKDGKALSVIAVDIESGEKLVDRVLFEVEEPEPINSFNSYASPSPVVSEDAVYVHFGTYGTARLDPESGDTVWERRDIRCIHLAGPGSSPFLYGETLILTMDGADIQYLMALSCETGEMVWGTKRSTDFTDIIPDFQKAYSTPILLDNGGIPMLISSGAQATYAYDPRNGEEIWSFPYSGFSMSARPVVYQDQVILNSGFNKPHLFSIPWDWEGKIPEGEVDWIYKRNVPQMSSCLVVDDLLYMADDGGVLTCLECASGEVVYRERLGGQHCASPIAIKDEAGHRLYFFNRSGECHIVRAGREYELINKNQLESGFFASPVPLDGGLLLRSETHLYRIQSGVPQDAPIPLDEEEEWQFLVEGEEMVVVEDFGAVADDDFMADFRRGEYEQSLERELGRMARVLSLDDNSLQPIKEAAKSLIDDLVEKDEDIEFTAIAIDNPDAKAGELRELLKPEIRKVLSEDQLDKYAEDVETFNNLSRETTCSALLSLLDQYFAPSPEQYDRFAQWLEKKWTPQSSFDPTMMVTGMAMENPMSFLEDYDLEELLTEKQKAAKEAYSSNMNSGFPTILEPVFLIDGEEEQDENQIEESLNEYRQTMTQELQVILSLEADRLSSIAEFDAGQKKKLELAARVAIKQSVSKRVEKLREIMANDWQDQLNSLETVQTLFQSSSSMLEATSVWTKTVSKSLNPEQRAAFEKLQSFRHQNRHEAIVGTLVLGLGQEIPMSGKEARSFKGVLMEQLPQASDYFKACYGILDIPFEKFEAALPKDICSGLSQSFSQLRGMVEEQEADDEAGDENGEDG